MNNSIDAGRLLMGDSLGFHIIFVMFGLSLPVLVSWLEHVGIKKKDKALIEAARKWSKIMAIMVITGVLSGTLVALQMSLIWPGILKFGGEVIGLPFMFETYAFILEATFLSLYMYTWNSKRVSPRLHNLFGWITALGAAASAYAITSINGWMNHPSGFKLVNGELKDISIGQAMFSDSAIITFLHSMPAYFMSVALIVAGVYSYKLLKIKKKDRQTKNYTTSWFILKRMMLFSIMCLVALFITADLTGKYLAKHEPVKLAAIELKYHTSDKASLLIGGVGNEDGTISGPHFEIPKALSLLAGNVTSYEVKGLSDFPKDERPPLYMHTLFNIKMTLMNLLVLILIIYIVVLKWRRQWLTSNWLLISLLVSGIVSTLIMEFGWMITEIGRQPWAVRGYVTTEQAFTKTGDMRVFGYIFPLAYALLAVVTIMAIRRTSRNDKAILKGAAK